MRKRSRNWVAVLLTLLFLVGCTSSKQGAESPSKLPEKPVELVILTTFGFSREALDDIVDLYEAKHKNVKVRVKENRFGGFTNQDGSVNQALLEGIDIMLQSSGFAQYLFSKGIARDLANLRLPAMDPLVAGLAEEISKQGSARVGVPLQLSPVGLTLNTEAFRRANVALPPVDWTIQEFEQSLLQLKDAGVMNELDLSFVFDAILGAYAGQILDPATGEANYDRPETLQALTWLGQAVRNELLVYTPSTEMRSIRMGGPDAPPINGMFGGMSNLPPNTLIQPMPRGPAGRTSSFDGTVGMVLQNSANPEVATDFLQEMLADPEAQRTLARSGTRPLINDNQALAIWREQIGDRNAEAIELSLASAVPDRMSMWGFADDLQPFFEGKASLEQILPTLKQRQRP